jgi:hypothetical protein
MEKDIKTPLFSRALLTAVFVGIKASVLSIIYDAYFKETLHFPLSDYINVSTLIFGINLLFFAIGFIYYCFIRMAGKGEIVYIVLFILLTVLGIWEAERSHRTDDQVLNSQFRTLLAGIIVIAGLLASVAIPLLFHSKKFEKYVV